MNGHGWVIPNSGGVRARCGGPGLCLSCSQELVRHPQSPEDATAERLALIDELLVEAQRWLQEMFDNPGGQAGPRAHAMTRIRDARNLLNTPGWREARF